MAGYKSVVFDPSAMQTEINTASSVAALASNTASAATVKAAAASAGVSDASSKAGVATAAASDAGSKAGVALAAASDAGSKVATRSATWDKASAASSALLVLSSSVIRSIPGSGSFVIKEFVFTAASQIKARISSVAVV